MRAWPLVVRREVIVKLTDRTFIISTLVTLALIVAFMLIQALTGGRTEHFTLTATPDSGAMAEDVAAQATHVNGTVVVTVDDVPDAATARAHVRSDASDAWLHRNGATWILTSRTEVPLTLQSVTAQIIRETVLAANAADAGTSMAALEHGSGLRTDLLSGRPQNAGLTRLISFGFAFLFYIAALLFGIQLAGSVVEEKQSRIIEIIATSIPLRQLLAGKVVGNTILAFGQLALYTAVGFIGFGFTAYSGLLPRVSHAIVWFLVFFVAGFIALASLWAVAGSLASRHEDLQSTTPPLTMLVMGMFFGGLFLRGTWLTIGSFVPPLSAVLMPIRLLQGDIPWWEPVAALVLLLVFASATVVLGERIYRRALLQTQGRLSLRQAWRAEE